MKFIKQFATDELMNEAALQIHHKDGAFVYQSQMTKFIDERHPGPNCLKLHVNMSPVKLDSSSTKKAPAIADILYSTSDGKLTLDAQTNSVDNTPIAICVITQATENFKNGDDSTGAVKTARFVSLNYMNCDTPATGSKEAQSMYFGNRDTIIGNVKGGTSETSYVGGKWNTQQCLFKATNQDKNICGTSISIINRADAGYSPAACCCVAYSTPGTKPGDWYLPMPGEMYQIYANKAAINEKRTAIKGSSFSRTDDYWCSREYSSVDAYNVNIGFSFIDPSDKVNPNYVLGFLALEVPSYIQSFKQQVNMDPVKLDSSSTKKTPAVADILYSTSDGKLTLDKTTNGVTNTAIAICVIPEVSENFKNGDDSTGAVKTARFVSLNYMNYNTPTTGSIGTQTMYFGNNGITIGNVKGGTDKTSYIGGKWNTQQCVSKAINQDQNICDGITNNPGTGYCAPACCCVAYSTLGTNPGDWYLPMPGELYQIYANKTAINEKRTTLVGSGFSESFCYWSSIEQPNCCEYYVGLNNGDFIYNTFKDNDNLCVLGFLTLEV